MNPTLKIWDAAQRLAHVNDDKAAHVFADMMVKAAEAGELPAEAVAEAPAFPLIYAISGRRTTRTESPKTLNHSSPVCLFKACEWFAAKGYAIPDKALHLLPEGARAALASAKTIQTAQGAQGAKDKILIGLMLKVLAPHLPPSLRHGGKANATAILAKVAECLQGVDGQMPHGWKKSALAGMVQRAESAAAEFLKSIAPDGFGAIQLEPAAGATGDNEHFKKECSK